MNPRRPYAKYQLGFISFGERARSFRRLLPSFVGVFMSLERLLPSVTAIHGALVKLRNLHIRKVVTIQKGKTKHLITKVYAFFSFNVLFR